MSLLPTAAWCVGAASAPAPPVVNATLGAGIFVLPGEVGPRLGSAAPLASLVCASTMALIVGALALTGRRAAVTGGPDANTEAAFGPYLAFVGGVLLWLSCVLAAGSVGAALATTGGLLLPALGEGAGRGAFLALLFGGLPHSSLPGRCSGSSPAPLSRSWRSPRAWPRWPRRPTCCGAPAGGARTSSRPWR